MPMTFTLVERTPYLLRYECVVFGEDTGSVTVGVIPNEGGVSPDLTTDADVWLGQPIDLLVKTAGITTGVQAAQLFVGSGLNTVDSLPTRRGTLAVQARDTFGGNSASWFAIPIPDPLLNGFAAIQVTGPNDVDATAYVELRVRHTFDDL
jgi:hypothetical protein